MYLKEPLEIDDKLMMKVNYVEPIGNGIIE